MGGFIYFTEEQKERVRQTDLAAYLRKNGYKLKQSGSEYEWESPQGKVTIRGNRWYHQYDEEGGYVIRFFERFYNLTFQETMLMLLEEQGIRYEAEEEEVNREKKPFALPEANDSMRRIYAYLLKERHLDREVIQYFIHNKMIYEDAKYHNVIFVGRDEEGVPRHAHKRGASANSSYKGNVESSNPNYSFHYVGTSNRVYVFEAPVDMLSYISLYKEQWQGHSYVSLCSVAPHALIHVLKNNPHIQEVYPCLDHDKAGIEGDYRIAELVKELGKYKIRPQLPQYKDWNEGLKALHGIEPLPAVEHEGLREMKQRCARLVKECNGVKVKNLAEQLEKKFETFVNASLTDDEQLAEQSYELSWVAFLFGKNKLDSMGKHYTCEAYAKMLFQLYPPHKDHVGYKSRLSNMREDYREVVNAYRKDEIVLESEQMNLVKKVLQLSVDCLRFSMYAEQKVQEQKGREAICQVSQASS